MKFYQLILTHYAGESAGFDYFTTLHEAEKAARKWAKSEDEDTSSEIKMIEIEPSKDGILRALVRYASHPDNG